MSSTVSRWPVSTRSPRTWTERVQVIRCEALAETQAQALRRRLEKAEAAVRALTPPVGPGRSSPPAGSWTHRGDGAGRA